MNRSRMRAVIKKPLSFEYDFYTKLAKNNFVFPLLYESKILDPDAEGNVEVEYTFEYMEPLMEGGEFSMGMPYFGPAVRAGDFDSLLLDSTVFALHILYGLHVLHEDLKVVHCNISPENVLYSYVDDCWKLNGFSSALPLEDSLKTKRTVGTQFFIAPESAETGIFTKESDVYSLGYTMYLTFHIKLMFFLEMGNDDDEVEEYEEDEFGYNPRIKEGYDDFFRIVQKMIYDDAGARSTIIDSMTEFLRLFDKIRPSDTTVYGYANIIPRVRALCHVE